MATFVSVSFLMISQYYSRVANKLAASYNILYDPASHSIVGLFDFDFAFVSHPVHEYLESFHMMKGNLQDSEHVDAISKGALGEHPPHDGITTEDWAIAREWDSLLAKYRALKPSDISGLEDLRALRKCEGLIAPYVLCHPMLFRRFNDDDLARRRMEAEKELSEYLVARGF